MDEGTGIVVRKTITVAAPQDRAFEVFTTRLNSWWPRSHHIGAADTFTAVMEPRPGGRCFERGDDGSECEWGHVQVWDPPATVVFSWEISADWKHDPSVASQVEVRFVPEGPNQTRVELEHHGIEVYGERAEELRTAFDSPGGWTGILTAFAERVAVAS